MLSIYFLQPWISLELLQRLFDPVLNLLKTSHILMLETGPMNYMLKPQNCSAILEFLRLLSLLIPKKENIRNYIDWWAVPTLLFPGKHHQRLSPLEPSSQVVDEQKRRFERIAPVPVKLREPDGMPLRGAKRLDRSSPHSSSSLFRVDRLKV